MLRDDSCQVLLLWRFHGNRNAHLSYIEGYWVDVASFACVMASYLHDARPVEQSFAQALVKDVV